MNVLIDNNAWKINSRITRSYPFAELFSHRSSITQMLSSKDINFVGYTYKNFEIVNDYQVPGMGIALSHIWI